MRKADTGIFKWIRRSDGSILQESDLGPGQILATELFDAGFPEGDSNYNCCEAGSDGRIYFALSTHHPNRHARLFCFDPSTRHLELVFDIGNAVKHAGEDFLAQGKIHVNLFEFDGKFYTATHRSVAPGSRAYSGGRFLEFNIGSSGLNVVGVAPAEEGIISMTADYRRKRLYGLTWPSGFLLSCDLAARATTTIGRVFGKGERGRIRMRGSAPVCRSLALEPRNGAVFWSDSRGRIRAYSPESDSVNWVRGCRLMNHRFFGSGIWRQIVWHPGENVFYGVQDRSNMLFRFDPYRKTVDHVDHIPAAQYRNKKTKNEPRATLAFRLAPDGETLYYMAAGPPIVTGENHYVRRTLHFITYHLPTGRHRDLGILRLADGRYPVDCQSMIVHDHMLYAVCWVEIPSGISKSGSRFEAIRRARADFAPISSEGFIEEVNLIRLPVPGHGNASA